MRQVRDKAEFDKILEDAWTCVYIDSRRKPTSLQLLVFDDVALCTRSFLPALKTLMGWSRDSCAYYAVLLPDPEAHFYSMYRKYPVLEIARDESVEAYLGALNEDLGDGKGFSLGDLNLMWVVMAASNKWFIHAIRSAADDSGHLWIPPEWVDKLLAAHPGFFCPEPASTSGGVAGAPGSAGSK